VETARGDRRTLSEAARGDRRTPWEAARGDRRILAEGGDRDRRILEADILLHLLLFLLCTGRHVVAVADRIFRRVLRLLLLLDSLSLFVRFSDSSEYRRMLYESDSWFLVE